MKNLDILIPFYVDHEDRLHNLIHVTDILKKYNCCNIYLNEHYTQEPKATFIKNVSYTNIKIQEEYFNKMKCINEMAKLATGKFLAIYDVDVILPKSAILESIEMLEKEFDFVYPFNGKFLNVPKNKINSLYTNSCINTSDCILIHPNSCGGCVIFKKDVFREGGMCNPNFKNVGYDDNELQMRFLNLGYKMGRTSNPLLHLEHSLSHTSCGTSVYYKHNEQEFYRICNMDKNSLLNEIKKWK